MKKTFHIIKEVISWVLLVAAFIIMAATIYANATYDGAGGGAFVFGYRPVAALSDSMEPHMLTYSISLTKAVDSIEELSVGDVISFCFEDSEGTKHLITHRIISIEGDTVYTKGDNNRTADNIPLTMENIEAKVIFVCNAPGWLVDKWQSSTSAKVLIVSISVSIILVLFLIRSAVRDLKAKRSLSTEAVPQAAAPSADKTEASPAASLPPLDLNEPLSAGENDQESVPLDN